MRFKTLFLLCVIFVPAALAQIPTIADGGILNGASFVKGQAVAPGSLVSLFGTNLAADLAQADSIPLSTNIAGVSVTFNGVKAPLYFVSSGQINAQVPWEVSSANSLNVVVQRGSNSSAIATVSQVGAAPGLFLVPGSSQAIAINGDGTLAAAPGAISGLNTHPAKSGDVLIVYATGLGAVDIPVASGANSLDQLRRTVGNPTVSIGGVPASVAFSGLTPQFPGVNQLNIVVPTGVATGGSVPISIQLNGITHQATLAIQ